MASAQVPLLSPTSTEAGAEAPVDSDYPDAVEALIATLEDEGARAKLTATLRASLAASQAEPETGAPAEAPAEEAGPSLQDNVARTVAEHTRALAEKGMVVIRSFDKMTDDITEAMVEATQVDYPVLAFTLTQLALAIGVVFVAFLGLRWILAAVTARLGRGAERRGTLAAQLSHLAPAVILNVLAVALAWAAGYAFSLIFGRAGQMSIYQTLFLNAFLVIEVIKVVVNAVLMPRQKPLRVVPFDDTDATYWYFWASRLISFVGYGTLFAVPVVSMEISQSVGQAVSEVVIFLSLLLVIVLILQNKTRMKDALHRRLNAGNTDFLGRVFAIIGDQWHRILILYAVAFFVIWMTDPGNALNFMVVATVRTILAIVAGVAVTVAISHAIALGLRLPSEVKRRLPLLEDRLNAFVPTVLKAVRIVVVVAVVFAIADAWSLMEVAEWVLSAQGRDLFGTLASVLVILAIGVLLYLAMASWVEFRLNPEVGHAPTPRETTLLSLLRNAFTILLCIVLAMMVLSEIGVNIGPLIAGAGVFGLAISFGAQKFVQDVITGIFIQFENAMNTGDVVTAAGITGVVEQLTIRSVSIRSLDGTLHFIPFSTVDSVSNYMKHFSFHVAAIGVAYREDIGEVKLAMQEAFDRLMQLEDHAAVILGDLEMHGVTEFADSAVTVRARIKTLPGSQWGVGRAYNELIKEVFDARGIEIPFPHMTLYMGEDKNGMAPPIHIAGDGIATVGGDADPVGPDRRVAAQRRGDISPSNQDGPDADDE
ncbi:mechanosensitive ion channel domain-containing protein [Chachezhania sediminis]|uniref:mechanosensitive ion channel domain-containing protein n=1 Tax=Chachezhania sediminis TaxID=2599291 RepID=UPI001E4DCC83|nr:mechanosensitive ion channel domain-containing protein [Chachezhania sediminis]